MSVITSYTIQMASKISGVGVHTIRAWEKRYKALEPLRDSSGHRTYTKTDIEKLMLLSELCLLGYTISKVAKLSIPDLKLLLIDLGKTEESIDSHEFNLVKERPMIDASLSTSILLFALRSYKIDVIHQELGKLKALVSSRDMALDLILPLSLEINALVSRGELSRVQEEVVTSLLRLHTSRDLYMGSETNTTNTRRDKSPLNVAVVGIDSDSFDLSLTMSGLLCSYYGFNFNFLGPGLSVEAVIDSVKIFNSGLVILSTASSNKNSAQVQSFVEKLMSKSHSIDVVLNAKLDLDLEKFQNKRFLNFKSMEAFDEYLAKKTH